MSGRKQPNGPPSRATPPIVYDLSDGEACPYLVPDRATIITLRDEFSAALEEAARKLDPRALE